MSNLYSCTVCREKKPAPDMQRATNSTMSGRCRKCHSEYCAFRLKLKKAEMSPHNYMTCDSCDHLFYKFVSASVDFYNGEQREQRVNCPSCKSENIQNY